MNKQVNLRLPAQLKSAAEAYAEKHGYGSVQEFIKEALREKLFSEVDKKEIVLAMKLLKAAEKNKLYATEKELFKKLS